MTWQDSKEWGCPRGHRHDHRNVSAGYSQSQYFRLFPFVLNLCCTCSCNGSPNFPVDAIPRLALEARPKLRTWDLPKWNIIMLKKVIFETGKGGTRGRYGGVS